jgi:hypothetical protein
MLHRMSMRTAALSLLFLLQANFAAAEEVADTRGQILKSNGEVYVVDQQGVEHKVGDENYEVHEMDTIVTRDGGKAVVQFNDGAMSVLDEKSSLRVEKSSWFSHLGGKIYFTFRKVFGEPKRVKTPFSTIGVRGTTFIVYADASGNGVALQEGRLNIESPGEEYELHIRREQDEFAAFKQEAQEKTEEMNREFDSYKNQIKREFVEYRKSFTLDANRVIRFNGNRVDLTSMDSADNAEISAAFGDFEQEAGELLEQFRAQAKKHREQQADEKPDEF